MGTSFIADSVLIALDDAGLDSQLIEEEFGMMEVEIYHDTRVDTDAVARVIISAGGEVIDWEWERGSAEMVLRVWVNTD